MFSNRKIFNFFKLTCKYLALLSWRIYETWHQGHQTEVLWQRLAKITINCQYFPKWKLFGRFILFLHNFKNMYDLKIKTIDIVILLNIPMSRKLYFSMIYILLKVTLLAFPLRQIISRCIPYFDILTYVTF